MRRGASPLVGIFGIGLAAYWPQFEGLRERLEEYQQGIQARLEAMGAEVVSAGLVDTAPAARRAGANLAAAGVAETPIGIDPPPPPSAIRDNRFCTWRGSRTGGS